MRYAILLVFFLIIATPACASDEVPAWNMVVSKSSINVTFMQMKMPVTASFERFNTEISFDPDHLTDSRIKAEIDIGSFMTGDKDRDATARTADWFDSGTFPVATFETAKIKKISTTTFEAVGNLTIKGAVVPVTLPFTLEITKTDSGNKKAVVTAQITLDRTAFKLGQGEWSTANVIANDVVVDIHLTAFAK